MLVVEQGDIFSGLVVDSVLGMQYFATDSFKDSPEGVPENVQPFVSGGYERNEEVWKCFRPSTCSRTNDFWTSHSGKGGDNGRNITLTA